MPFNPDLLPPQRDGAGGTLYLPSTFIYGWALPHSRGQHWLPFQSGVYKQTFKHLRSILKWVKPSWAALTTVGQQRGILHPFCWQWRGLTKPAQGKVDLCPTVEQMWAKSGDASGKPILGYSRRKHCWDCNALGAPTHTLVLSCYTWLTAKGPLLSLHGAVIFEQSEVCPSAGTLLPQSQPIEVAVLWLQPCHWAQEPVPVEEIAVYCGM